MDKNQITDDGNQSTDFLTLTGYLPYIAWDENSRGSPSREDARIKLPAVCGTHGKPNFGLFIHFYSC